MESSGDVVGLIADDLRMDLDRCSGKPRGRLRAEQVLCKTTTLQATLWEAGKASREDVLVALSEALAGVADAALPPETQRDARDLHDAIAASLAGPDRFQVLPQPAAGSRPLLMDSYALARKVMIADLLGEVAAARAAAQHDRVIALLTTLGGQRELDSQQQEWLDEAQSELDAAQKSQERRKLARSQLDVAQAILVRQDDDAPNEWAAAKTALELAVANLRLSDITVEAQAMRQAALTLWRQLARKPAELTVALRYVRDGMNALAPWPKLLGKLRSDQRFFEAAGRLEELTEGMESWPGLGPGSAEQLSEIQGHLDELDKELTKLSLSWPQLRKWADERQGAVVGRLGDLLDGLAQEAELAQQETRFDDVQDLVVQGLQLTNGQRWKAPLSQRRARLQNIGGGELTHLAGQADYQLAALRADLEAGRLRLGTDEMAQRLHELLSPGASSVLRPARLLGQVHATVRLCRCQPHGSLARVQAIQVLSELTSAAPEPIALDWPWLMDQVPAWREAALTRGAEWAGELAQDLNRLSRAFAAGREPDPARLAELTWQARWALAALPVSAGMANGARASEARARLRAARQDLQQALSEATLELPRSALEGALGVAIERAIDAGRDLDDRLAAGQEALNLAGQLSAWAASCRSVPAWLPATIRIDPLQSELPSEKWLGSLTSAAAILATARNEGERNRAAADLLPLLESYLGAL